MKPVVIAIVGPTAVGKTDAAIRMANRLNGEIVSMDSMQIYRRMDIGTAKPTKEERSRAPHHMIDVAEPTQRFTTSDYRNMASGVIDDILRRGKLPILAGGTGLYLQALSYEMSLGQKGADEAYRQTLMEISKTEKGAERLHAMLAVVDPVSAERLHPNDIHRVVRALEVYHVTGAPASAQRDESQQVEGAYHILVYGLSLPREIMYARINERVDAMMEAGLAQEVRSLLSDGIAPNAEGGAMQAIGYKEIAAALSGEYSMERAVELVKQGSRRYAKRQWTWFRHDARTKWFDWTEYSDKEALLCALESQIRSDISEYGI